MNYEVLIVKIKNSAFFALLSVLLSLGFARISQASEKPSQLLVLEEKMA